MVCIRVLVLALAVVQKSKQFHDQQVRTCRQPNCQSVLADSCPMLGTVCTMPVYAELCKNDFQQASTIEC